MTLAIPCADWLVKMLGARVSDDVPDSRCQSSRIHPVLLHFFSFSPAVSSAASIVMRFPHAWFLFSQVNGVFMINEFDRSKP